VIHLVLASTTWTRRLDFDLFTLNLCLVQVFHCFFSISYVIKFNELVVFLVGGLSDLLNLSVLSKSRLQLFIAGRRVKIENDQSALVLIFFRGIVLGD
jgi:hypothetical protein